MLLIGDRPDIADLLAVADVAVVTSDGEGSPLFVQEAMRSGVPLVATAVPGVVELVGDGAQLVAPGSPDEVEAAVAALLDDSGRRAVLRAAGLAQAATWPTEAQAIAGVLGVYDEIRAAAEADTNPDSASIPT